MLNFLLYILCLDFQRSLSRTEICIWASHHAEKPSNREVQKNKLNFRGKSALGIWANLSRLRKSQKANKRTYSKNKCTYKECFMRIFHPEKKNLRSIVIKCNTLRITQEKCEERRTRTQQGKQGKKRDMDFSSVFPSFSVVSKKNRIKSINKCWPTKHACL